MELWVLKITIVSVLIVSQCSKTCLLWINKLTNINESSFIPDFFTNSVLLIIDPVSNINGSCIVDQSSFAIGFTVLPLALVDITIWVGHSSHAYGNSVFNLALIDAVVRVQDFSDTIWYARLIMCFEPMTSILDTFVIKVFVVPSVIFVVRVHQLMELSLGEDWLLLVVDKVEGLLINVSHWFDIFQFQTCNLFSLLYPHLLSLNPCDTTSGKPS